MNKPRRFSPFFYNWITYFGVWLAFFIFLAECFLFVIDHYAHGSNLYLGLLTYLLLPPVLIFGLVLIPVGALWKKHRVRQGRATLEPKPLVIDPSISTHRNAIFVFMTGTFILVVISMVGAYKGFHYTESVKFCGALCHQVMNPEYTTYKKSPHNKVKCVECHIGAGAGWYVQSKISGVRQVVKAVTHTYERPIHTPVHNLRPAQETCAECHSPGKFFGTMDFSRDYFLTEGENQKWHIRMLLNVGADEKQSYGVHAHMNVDHDIYYAAEDERRQNITWVKSIDKQGKETVYTTPKSKWKDSSPPEEAVRKMDCIDCHNRPTHQYVAPYRLLNDAMSFGKIDPEIPNIKEKAMALMAKTYTTNPEATAAIHNSLREYYRTRHTAYYEAHKEKIETAIAEVSRLFETNIFPEMKTRWDTHPDNIGHLISPGCFRCHDGQHRDSSERVISKNCNSCHLIVEQGAAGKIEKNIDGLEFVHPDGGEDWKEMSCNDCHTGT